MQVPFRLVVHTSNLAFQAAAQQHSRWNWYRQNRKRRSRRLKMIRARLLIRPCGRYFLTVR
jgi:hypothetical protein